MVGGLMMSRIEIICGDFWLILVESMTNRCTYVLIDTCVREEFQELELTQCPKAKQSVFKRKNLLNGNLTSSGFVGSGDDSAVRALTYSMEDLIVFTYDKIDSRLASGMMWVCLYGAQDIPVSNLGRGFCALRDIITAAARVDCEEDRYSKGTKVVVVERKGEIHGNKMKLLGS